MFSNNRNNRNNTNNSDNMSCYSSNMNPFNKERRFINNSKMNEKKYVKKEPTFDMNNSNFPSLSSGTSTPKTANSKNNDKNTLNFSKMLQSTPITKEQAHPKPKKKFVSLVNLSKKTKYIEEKEFETDEEVEEMIEEQYNSMDEELEQYYNEERAKEDYIDYDY